MLRTFAFTLALLFSAGPTLADGRADWRGYDWKSYPFAACAADVDAEGLCPVHHAKWDWKRDQWVDVAYGVGMDDRIRLKVVLTNNDPRDDDDVCVTVLLVDGQGRNVAVHHQNRHSNERSVDTNAVIAAGPRDGWRQAAQILVGSKQCRDGAHEDDAVAASVLGRLGQ